MKITPAKHQHVSDEVRAAGVTDDSTSCYRLEQTKSLSSFLHSLFFSSSSTQSPVGQSETSSLHTAQNWARQDADSCCGFCASLRLWLHSHRIFNLLCFFFLLFLPENKRYCTDRRWTPPYLSERMSSTLLVEVKDRYVERKMVTKEESPMENEWRRWSTSFSSVPAFTHWERDIADWRTTGRNERGSYVSPQVWGLFCRSSPPVTHDSPSDCWGSHVAVWPPPCRSRRPPLPPPLWTVEQRNQVKSAFMCPHLGGE